MGFSLLDVDTKTRMATKGFAIPDYSDVARAAQDEAAAKAATKACTIDAPCDFGAYAWEQLGSLALSPGAVLLYAILAYSIGFEASKDVDIMAAEQCDDKDIVKRGEQPEQQQEVKRSERRPLSPLQQQAERSQERKRAALRDLASQLRPVQDVTGWQLEDDEGLPRMDAYVFIALAAAVQLAVFSAVADALRGAPT
jgi:hypothetical protein